MIHAVIHICPECRDVQIYNPNTEGLIADLKYICPDDGYTMKRVMLDDILVMALLKGEVTNANS